MFVCCNVVDGREYHVRLYRVGARAAADRGCVSIIGEKCGNDARRGNF